MVRLIKKDKLSNKNESKYYIKEGKQVGNLYHVCTLDALVEYIIPENKLESSGKYLNELLDTYEAVSFTRDKLFVVPTYTVKNAPILFQFVVDGDKLSDKYKITPYNGNGSNHKYFEKEEVVIGPITNFKSYIKEVYFDIKNLNELYDLRDNISSMLEEVKKYLGSIKCTRTTLPIIGNDWKHHYKKAKDESYNINTLDELINLLNNFEKDTPSVEDIDTIDLFLKWFHAHDYSNDVDEFKSLIEAHPKFKSYIKNSNILFSAIRNHNPELIKFLLDSGCNIEKVDDLGRTPLCYACLISSLKVVKLLIELGADILKKDSKGDSPLVCSCEREDSVIAKYLLSINHSNINDSNKSGETALFIVCCKSKDRCMDFLNELTKYDIKDSIDKKDEYGRTPIDMLLKYRNITALITLSKLYSIDLSGKDSDGNTVILKACQTHDVDFVKSILDLTKDAYINEYNNKHECPLAYSIRVSDYDIAKLLLKHGADPNIESNYYEPIIFDTFHRREFLDILLEHGADPNLKDSDKKNTFFYDACSYARRDIVDCVLSKSRIKPDINFVSSDGYTPFLCICANIEYDEDYYEIIKLLVENGADTHAKDKEGNNGLDLCLNRQNTKTVKYLLSIGLEPTKPEYIFKLITNSTYKECLKDLFSTNILKDNLNKISDDGTTILSVTYIFIRDMSLVKELLELGADPTKDRLNAVYMSCLENDIDACKLFISYSDNTKLKDMLNDNDKNPWDIPLFVSITNNRVDIAKLLIEHGADINIKAKDRIDILSFISTPSSDIHKETLDFLNAQGIFNKYKNNPDSIPDYVKKNEKIYNYILHLSDK